MRRLMRRRVRRRMRFAICCQLLFQIFKSYKQWFDLKIIFSKMNSNCDSNESQTNETNGQTISESIDTEDNQTNPSIDSSKIFVINFGSLFLRIGRSSDSCPKSVYNVIARKNRSKQVLPQEETYLLPINTMTKELDKTLKETQKCVTNCLNSCVTSSGRLRTASNTEVINDFNKRSKPIVLPKNTSNDRQWTQLNGTEDVVIGEDVLHLKPGQPFHIRWPIRRGQLNVNNRLGGSLTSVISDLESICRKAIETDFGIDFNDLSEYKVVLIVSDIYNRNHLKYLINMLLNGLGFQSCLVIHEAVCATFGAGLTHACVVDVGDQKTSICCIEDGFGSRTTRLTLSYGGNDITQLFHYFLKQRGFPYVECKHESTIDSLFLDELKQRLCHLSSDSCGQNEKHFRIDIPEQPILEYTILVGDECLLAPLGLFYPEMFALTLSCGKRMRILHRNDGHSDDPFDENYLIQTKRKYGESNDISGQSGEAVGKEGVIEDDLDAFDVSMNDKEINSDQQVLGLDQAIIQCIDHCESDEVKRRMYGSILLVGGGLAFNQINKWIENRICLQMPNQFKGQKVEIIIKPKDIEPQLVSWRGAAVLSLLDSAQEMWITSEEWNKSGLRILREKASFVL